MASMNDDLVIAGRTFRSRLLIGTGKYRSFPEMRECHEASGAEVVTVAVRRVNLDRSSESLLDYIDTSKFFCCPTRRPATRWMKQCGRRVWGAKWA